MGVRTEKEYEVHYYEVNYRLDCKMSSIINYFCDIGAIQSNDLGVGIDYLTERRLAWVFYKYDIKVKRYPKFGEKIRVVTSASSFKKFYASRLYEIYDENNERIVEGEGILLLINIDKRRAIRIPEDQYEAYNVLETVLNYELKELNVVFEKECKYGVEIIASYEVREYNDELIILHKIENNEGTELSILKSKWSKVRNYTV